MDEAWKRSMFKLKKDHEESVDAEVRREAEKTFAKAERRSRTEPVLVPFEQRYRIGLLPGSFVETARAGDLHLRHDSG